ncbi:MAG: adenosylcobinamide-GDP ribazoletransferase [Pleurocapsa minor GSE-CHR-MK-17-07R]|jgi:adenosylcobinamide-GDP ribazoletransferase|nr:adenosylcobinamide-GDP ribazoletransferase [Pleurocapsa minor GSE-CHR-MK 17-07R]
MMNPLGWLLDFRAAVSFLTILPLGMVQGRKPAWSVGFFPLIGAGIGFGLAFLTTVTVFSQDVMAFLALAFWVIVTGGLHLDGFADACDGLFATTTPARRLEIMKDPRAGSWAVIGIGLLLLGKFILLRNVPPPLLLLAPLFGRMAIVYAMAAHKPARPDGLGAWFRDGLGPPQVALAAAITVAITLLVLNYLPVNPLAFVAIVAVVPVTAWWASRRLGGGLTGDIYGFVCELTELVALLALAWAYRA